MTWLYIYHSEIIVYNTSTMFEEEERKMDMFESTAAIINYLNSKYLKIFGIISSQNCI